MGNFTQVSNDLLDSQAQLGLSASAFNLYVHLSRFKYGDRHPHPSVSTLAMKMGISERHVQHLATELESMGLVRRIYSPGRMTQWEILHFKAQNNTPEPQFTTAERVKGHRNKSKNNTTTNTHEPEFTGEPQFRGELQFGGGVNCSSPEEYISSTKAVTSPSGEVVEAGKKPPLRPRKQVAKQTDPQTNPKLFLEEIEKAGTLVVWARDMKAVKNIMASRVRAGVPDVITELWGMWKLFVGGAVDAIYKMDGRAHDIQSFCMTYSELLERSNGSVKPGRAGCVCGGGWKREYSPAVGDIWRCEKCKRMKESEHRSGFRERK